MSTRREERLSAVGDAVRKVTARASLDPKRSGTERQGTHGWFPYYAGYAGAFVEQILRAVREACGAVRVLDPWNGSGTTSLIAHRLGHVPVGFDINPVLSIVSAAKIAHADDALHLSGLARTLAASPLRVDRGDDPLRSWLGPTAVAQYRGIEHALMSQLATTPEGASLHPSRDGLPPIAAFLLLALIRTARTYAGVKQGSNPTWVRPSAERRRPGTDLGVRWIEQVRAMAGDLKSAGEKISWNGRLGIADARELPLDDGSIDFVLTSPPYCTRIDYIVSASFELAALGIGVDADEFERLRKASMGTPLSRSLELPGIPRRWPTEVKRILTAIREHPSKASHSYYFRTYWQYFEDAMKSLAELHRVVRPGGAAVLVVQSSYYKDIQIDLPELYVACANAVGFDAEVTSGIEVRRAMSQINPHSRKHQAEKHYREGVVVLERSA